MVRDEQVGLGFRDPNIPALFDLLARIGKAVVATVGPDCEVVVHDLRHPEHSVVAISGHLTGRMVGAPIPDPQLLPGEVDKFAEDDLRHRATTPAGRELVASTVWIREPSGHIVGALCINLDLADLRQARDLIERRLGGDEIESAPLPTFAANVPEFTRLAVLDVLGTRVPQRRRLGRDERAEIVRRLDSAGVFALRGSARVVAAELGISRASLYADLRAARHAILEPPPIAWRGAFVGDGHAAVARLRAEARTTPIGGQKDAHRTVIRGVGDEDRPATRA